MRHIVRWMSASVPGLLLVAGMGLTACDKGSNGAAPVASATATPPPPTPTAPAAPAAASSADVAADEAINEDLRDYHRHHHHGGVTMFISMAIDTLGLDAAKKAQVEKIQNELHTKMAPARDAEHDLLSTIADGVGAGKIDNAAVDAAIAKVATASATIHTATADALTQLHDALSPAERAALVDKVKAHWDVWHKVNVDEKASAHDKGTHLAKLTELLALTPDQVDKIGKALSADVPVKPDADPKMVDAHIQAFATAFVADKFDPKALAPSATAAAGHIARHGGARVARFYEAITPVLTPDQRAKLAAHLKERLNDQHVASSK
ncbi:MAG: periplasmic heavy metal sensor [Polyangiaceae bacterium]|jgi:Spy/CpxP family protein refolding chaperone